MPQYSSLLEHQIMLTGK